MSKKKRILWSWKLLNYRWGLLTQTNTDTKWFIREQFYKGFSFLECIFIYFCFVLFGFCLFSMHCLCVGTNVAEHNVYKPKKKKKCHTKTTKTVNKVKWRRHLYMWKNIVSKHASKNFWLNLFAKEQQQAV